MITFKSFGFGQPKGVPVAHLVLDVRALFKDPAGISPEMRAMTGLDQAVIDNVLSQPGAAEYVAAVAEFIKRLAATVPNLVVAVGCVGGRHRSVAITTALQALLAAAGLLVSVEHRDVAEPIIQQPVRQPDFPPEPPTFAPGFP